MDSQLIEQLLHDSESSSLDFKRDQYPFDWATEEQKSELLKDVLAFANAWRRTEAFILIGVDDVQGGRSNPVGITSHIDDSKLQQFVNSKTNREIVFSCHAVQFDGVQLGVIRIENQERPFYLKSDYGRLKKGLVYFRQGSSTKIADTDEIYKMGRVDASGDSTQPILKLEFVDLATKTLVGSQFEMDSQPLLRLNHEEVPRYGRGIGRFEMAASLGSNTRYYHDLNKYLVFKSILRPVGYAITNLSNFVALDVRMELSISMEGKLIVVRESCFPKRPSKESPFISRSEEPDIVIESPHFPSGVNVEKFSDSYSIEIKFRKIQPKATVYSNGVMYVGTLESSRTELSAFVYADNLQSPLIIPLTIVVNAAPPANISRQMLWDYADGKGNGG